MERSQLSREGRWSKEQDEIVFRILYPGWKSGIFLWRKMTWRMGRAEGTGCQHPAALRWNGSAATPCPLLGWPAETMGCICKTAQLRHWNTSTRARQYQDKKTIERSLLFRLNNILKQIESNYNCLVLPDDLTPSVWISQEKKKKIKDFERKIMLLWDM